MTFRRESESRGRRLKLSEALTEKFGMSRIGYWSLLHVAPKIDKVIIPRTKGRLSATGIDKVGLLTSTGAKSGTDRVQPLVCIDFDDDSILLIGSNYGREKHPAWTYNLIANPDCMLEFRGEPAPYVARMLEDEEYDRAWDLAVDFYAGYATYKATSAPRRIRIARLDPEG
jgi:deazaflavin-dependent oxidoreductase (nitroreductase family)